MLTIRSLVVVLLSLYPSIVVMQSLEGSKESSSGLFICILGFQWYWSYWLNDVLIESRRVQFDSFNTLCLVVPVNYNIILLASSDNVIHSWFVPRLFLKLEVNPGYVNYYYTICNIVGTSYGNCAEICGSGHSFMPIKLEVVPVQDYITYYCNK